MDESLEKKPYRSSKAFPTFFQLAVRRGPEIAAYNPLALSNTHFVRELNDSDIDKCIVKPGSPVPQHGSASRV